MDFSRKDELAQALQKDVAKLDADCMHDAMRMPSETSEEA